MLGTIASAFDLQVRTSDATYLAEYARCLLQLERRDHTTGSAPSPFVHTICLMHSWELVSQHRAGDGLCNREVRYAAVGSGMVKSGLLMILHDCCASGVYAMYIKRHMIESAIGHNRPSKAITHYTIMRVCLLL